MIEILHGLEIGLLIFFSIGAVESYHIVRERQEARLRHRQAAQRSDKTSSHSKDCPGCQKRKIAHGWVMSVVWMLLSISSAGWVGYLIRQFFYN